MIPSFDYALYAILMYITIAWQYKKINKEIFISPLFIQILTFTISFFTVLYLYNNNLIKDSILNILLVQFFMYYFTFLIMPYFIKNKYLDFKKFINIKPFDLLLANIIFYISFIISLTYIALFWSMYTDGNERLIFNRDFRTLSLLNTLFSTWSITISSVIYAKYKSKKFLLYASIGIFFLLFMGSKGLALVGIFIFIFFYVQFHKINIKYKVFIGFIILCAIFIPTQIMYGNALEIISNRIMLSGDIYLYSFVIGDYEKLVDKYEVFSYILHPYTSLIGIRGYDFPLGAEIVGTANAPVLGLGPQDHITILALTFFHNCNSCIFIFTLFICIIIILIMLLNFYIFSITKIHITVRSVIFILIYTQIINIFVGINGFSFNVILSILVIVIYLFFLLIREMLKTKL